MKLLFVLPISFCFLFPTKTQALTTYQVSSVCENFATGKIDAGILVKFKDLQIKDLMGFLKNKAKTLDNGATKSYPSGAADQPSSQKKNEAKFMQKLYTHAVAEDMRAWAWGVSFCLLR